MLFLDLVRREGKMNKVSIPDDILPENLPAEYEQITKVTVTHIRPQMKRLNQATWPFINAAFEDPIKARGLLKEKGEVIPPELLQRLTTDLYSTNFNDLALEEQNIIKVLAVYICISIKKEGVN